MATLILLCCSCQCGGRLVDEPDPPTGDAGDDAGTGSGEPDAGAPDAGADAGEPDAGVPDAGAPDAAVADAGPIDLPVFDGGGQCGAANVIARMLSPTVLEPINVVPTSDGFALAFVDINSGNNVYFARRSPAGDLLEGPTLITSNDDNYDLGFAWNGQRSAVVWPVSPDGGDMNVSAMLATTGPDGTMESTTVAATGDYGAGMDDYAVVWNPASREWLVATYGWWDTGTGHLVHFTRLERFDEAGAAAAPAVNIDGGELHWMDAPIAPGDDGYVLALEDTESLTLNVLQLDLNAQVVSSTPLGHRIGFNVATARGPSTVAVAMGGYDAPGGSPVQLALIGSDGGVVTGSPMRVSPGSWVGVAWNGASYTLVYNTNPPDGGSELWETRYAESGNRVSGPRLLTCGTFTQDPRLVFTNGVHVVVYESYPVLGAPGSEQLLIFP
jgi:hypothetical protein